MRESNGSGRHRNRGGSEGLGGRRARWLAPVRVSICMIACVHFGRPSRPTTHPSGRSEVGGKLGQLSSRRRGVPAPRPIFAGHGPGDGQTGHVQDLGRGRRQRRRVRRGVDAGLAPRDGGAAPACAHLEGAWRRRGAPRGPDAPIPSRLVGARDVFHRRTRTSAAWACPRTRSARSLASSTGTAARPSRSSGASASPPPAPRRPALARTSKIAEWDARLGVGERGAGEGPGEFSRRATSAERGARLPASRRNSPPAPASRPLPPNVPSASDLLLVLSKTPGYPTAKVRRSWEAVEAASRLSSDASSTGSSGRRRKKGRGRRSGGRKEGLFDVTRSPSLDVHLRGFPPSDVSNAPCSSFPS